MTTSPTATPNPTPLKSENEENNTGLIIGATAGGLIFLVIAVVVVGVITWHCG